MKDEKTEGLFNSAIISRIKDYLIKFNETIAVAESVTSGLLQTAFGTTKDAAKFYQGGITAYNVGQKYRHLFIEPIHALSCNCISMQVAESMAVNVCRLFQSDWGMSITGYASPVPEADNEPFAYCAITHRATIVYAEKIKPEHDEPFEIQLEYTNKLLEELSSLMNTSQKSKSDV